jgi:hypothetical protein
VFEDLKKFLTSLPVLVSPLLEEPLMLYIVATTHVVSTAIVVEHQEEGQVQKVQCPVYFISKVLGESKVQHPQVQKLMYAVLITSRKLVHYFQQHKIEVITSFPIEDILHNREATGRIAKWSIEFGAFDI